MTNLKMDLINSLNALALELKKSKKTDTSNFFNNLAKQLESDTDVLDTLERIINSGSITQYANFSSAEDLIFEKIHNIAKKLRNQTLIN